MPHRLDPLLRPASVAVVGASARTGSMGDWALRNLRRGGFAGPVYPVNPNYADLGGLRCYASLTDVPATPDLVIFAVGDQRIEAALDDAIAAGVPAAVIMSTAVLDGDEPPLLKDRLQAKIRAAGMVVCGANGMGFYNVRDRVWGCGFDSAMHAPPGNVTLLSHSGAGMSGIIDCDERVRINLAVSTGNELSVTMDEYLDFALDLPETRAVGLFIETARNPEGFRAALKKAHGLRVPVVAIKVGKTEEAAKLAISHSGALTGDDAAWDALFDRCGVHRVRDMDELAMALVLFAELGTPGDGGLVTLHDSGGERQLLVDLAAEAGVPLTRLGSGTVAELEKVLDPELPAVNPLDAWSRGGTDFAEQMTRCLSLLMQDEGAALGAAILNRGPEGLVYPVYIDYVRGAKAASGKPVALVGARQGTGCEPAVAMTTHEGIPVVDGVATFLRGVRVLFDHRDIGRRTASRPPEADPGLVAAARERLRENAATDEAGALGLLAGFGLPVATPLRIDGEKGLDAAARTCGFPLVLKTAAPGIAHKSERGGVILGIGNAEQLAVAYRDMAARLGDAAIVAPQAGPGVEMILGMSRDADFGPVVVIGFGGVLAETLGDVCHALPPFDAAHARRCVDRLALRPLLDGVRGAPAADVDAFCELAARFSVLVHELRDDIREIDINPVVVHERGCTIVDALILAA